MEVSDNYSEFTDEQLVEKEKFHRNEAYKIKNIIIDKQLSERQGLVVQCCGSAKQVTDCPFCTYCENCKGTDKHNLLYGGNKIPNRSNLSDPFTFGETWKSNDTLKCDSFKQGVYAILCVKSTCKKRGVIYYGKSKVIRERVKSHIWKITGFNKDIQRVHKHFIQHGEEDGECPLKHVKIVPVKEVKNVYVLKTEEASFMIRFNTHGYGSYGCNDTIEFDDPQQGPSRPKQPKLSDDIETMEYRKPLHTATRQAREEIVPPQVLLAIALRNHPNSDPPFSAKTQQLTNFGTYYFKSQSLDQYVMKRLIITVNSGANPGTIKKLESDWFTWINKPPGLFSPRTFRYVFGFALGLDAFDETIEEEIQSYKDEIIKLLDPQKLKSNPNLLADMIKGLLGEAP